MIVVQSITPFNNKSRLLDSRGSTYLVITLTPRGHYRMRISPSVNWSARLASKQAKGAAEYERTYTRIDRVKFYPKSGEYFSTENPLCEKFLPSLFRICSFLRGGGGGGLSVRENNFLMQFLGSGCVAKTHICSIHAVNTTRLCQSE